MPSVPLMTSCSNVRTALCNELLHGCRKKSSTHRGSSCSRSTASNTAMEPALVSMVSKLITSSVVLPIELLAHCEAAGGGWQLRPSAASRISRIRGMCEHTSRMSVAPRPSSQEAGGSPRALMPGDRGGDGAIRTGAASPATPARPSMESSTAILTTSSSLCKVNGGCDNGESVGVDAATLTPFGATYAWKTTLVRIEADAATAPGLLLKTWSASSAIV
mmetsp:Transcript_60670/g.169550  ORF Transcript_60670/g.169550 Transcript_60670/m.169550 type:complete len:219 (-) Transcript_60670:431-1087(-)